MSIVMGLDQHRAQITAEWVDTGTGEVGRTRVTPAYRESVRRFVSRFPGQRLEVALEARLLALPVYAGRTIGVVRGLARCVGRAYPTAVRRAK